MFRIRNESQALRRSCLSPSLLQKFDKIDNYFSSRCQKFTTPRSMFKTVKVFCQQSRWNIYIYSNKTMPKTKNIFSSRERLLEIDGLEWRQAKEYMQPSQRERGKWRDYGIEKGCILVWMHSKYASGNTSIANRCCNTMQQTVPFLEMEDSECRHRIFYKLQGKEEKARKQVNIWMNYQIAQCLHR